MEELLTNIKEIGTGEIATVVGRYYAMDRDKRWERVRLALGGLILGEGEESTDPVKTIKERYEKGENDEFLKPIIVGGDERRIKGELFFSSMATTFVVLSCCPVADVLQRTIPSSSSTTGPTVFDRLPSSSAMSTDPHYPTSRTPRPPWLP